MVNSANYNITIASGLQSQLKVTVPVKFDGKPQDTNKPAIIKEAKIKYRKIKQSDKYLVQGDWSEDYVYLIECDNSSKKTEIDSELMNRYRLITFKIPTKSTYTYLKNCYKIDFIESPQRYCGAGTKAVQNLLEKSLADKDTEGRIIAVSEITDGETSPAGFFYKLGFRFIDKSMNDAMDIWVAKKIKTDAPKLTGMMYLPKNHINKLLMYNKAYF